MTELSCLSSQPCMRGQGRDCLLWVARLIADVCSRPPTIARARSRPQTLTKQVPEIDVILGGHDHLPYGEFHENTFIFKCGESAHWLGCLDLDIEISVDADGTRECKVCVCAHTAVPCV